MAILPANLTRISNQLRADTALSQLQRTQAQLTKTQLSLATGRRLNAPSDDPGDAAAAQQVRKTLEKRDAYASNLDQAQSQLGRVDSTLNDVSALLLQAQQVASANVGDGVTQDERTSAAAIIRQINQQLVSLGNTSFLGSYLFSGDKLDQPPFVDTKAGLQYVGSTRTLENDVDEATTAAFQVDGAELFGALSTRIEGKTSLAPSVAVDTRLSDLNGATGSPVAPGSIRIGDGTAFATIDLSSADTLGDVISLINAAGLGAVTAAINAAGNGITLSGGGGDSITVNEVGGATTAAGIGLLTPVSPGVGSPVVGGDLRPTISPLTPLAALTAGAGLDPAGLTITNGTTTSVVDLAGATTVEDLLNEINVSSAGVRAEINSGRNGIRLVNQTQGTELRVSENGGTTADQLGLRSFAPDSVLSELNGGEGVRAVDGVDFVITDSNGTIASVDITASMATVADVINAINSAATTNGAGVTAAFSASTNGITLTDTAGGGGTLSVAGANFSQAAADLGIDVASTAGVITGRDVHPVVASGTFANLAKLEAAMVAGDQKAMTEAAEGLADDYDRTVRVRGEVGASVQGLESRQNRLQDQNLTAKAFLSELEDTDFTEALSRFALLQTSLQATLQATASTQNQSLMDFLR